MTKTLTEQWRDGTLEEGLYYVEGKGNYDIALIRNRYCPVLTSPYSEDDVFESEFVPVAPVPSYEEYKELVSKTDKLEKMAFHYTPEEWNTMMRMVERLQEQLKEANEVIKKYMDLGKWYDFYNEGPGMVADDMQKYLEKWGVK